MISNAIIYGLSAYAVLVATQSQHRAPNPTPGSGSAVSLAVAWPSSAEVRNEATELPNCDLKSCLYTISRSVVHLLSTPFCAAQLYATDLQYENRPTCNCSTVDLTEKCMVLVLAMYGGGRRMHAVHASPPE